MLIYAKRVKEIEMRDYGRGGLMLIWTLRARKMFVKMLLYTAH